MGQALTNTEMLELKAFFAGSDIETIRNKAFNNPKYKDSLTAWSSENLENLTTGMLITKKVAQSCDDEEWAAFLTTGTMPPVQLSPQEMELVRGGAVGTSTVGAGVTIGAGVSALVVIIKA